jgi:hypothetical protein
MKRSKRLPKLLEDIYEAGEKPLKMYHGGALVMVPHYVLVPKSELSKMNADVWEAVLSGRFVKIKASTKPRHLESDPMMVPWSERDPSDLGFEA